MRDPVALIEVDGFQIVDDLFLSILIEIFPCFNVLKQGIHLSDLLLLLLFNLD